MAPVGACHTSGVNSRTGNPDQTTDLTQPTEGPRRNPYIVGLAAFGGLAWMLALMLWIVLAEVTDYEAYDLPTASALTAWVSLLLLTGVAAVIASLAIAGVRYELRRIREE